MNCNEFVFCVLRVCSRFVLASSWGSMGMVGCQLKWRMEDLPITDTCMCKLVSQWLFQGVFASTYDKGVVKGYCYKCQAALRFWFGVLMEACIALLVWFSMYKVLEGFCLFCCCVTLT